MQTSIDWSKSDDVGKLSRYMGWVMKRRSGKAREIIVVSEPDDRLEYSILAFRGIIGTKYYRVKLETTDEFKDNSV